MAKVTLREKPNKNGFTYYLDIHHNGKRTYEFLEFRHINGKRFENKEAKANAEKIRNLRERQLQEGTYGTDFSFKNESSFILFYENTIKGKDKLKYSDYYNTLSQLKLFIANNKHSKDILLKNLDVKFLTDFKDFLINKYANNTAWNYFAKLKAVINIAVNEGYLYSNPIAKVKNKPTYIEPETKYLTLDEVLLFASVQTNTKLEYETKRAFLFGVQTGLRFSDLSTLKYQDIDIANRKVPGKIQKKTGQPIYVELNDNALSYIQDGKNIFHLPENFLFDLPDNKTCNEVLKKLAKRCELNKNLSFNVSRHTHATMLITNGYDILVAKDCLGHTSIVHTQRYAKVINERKKEAVNSFAKISI